MLLSSFDEDDDTFETADELHVTFFDNICSRAWVKKASVKKATRESLNKEVKIRSSWWKKELQTGKKRALEVLQMNPSKRGEVMKKMGEMATLSESDEDEEYQEDKENEEEEEEKLERPKKKRKRKRASSGEQKKPPASKKKKVSNRRASSSGSKPFSPPAVAGEELSEYERIRQRNIEDRMRLFRELNIGESKNRLAESFGSPENRPSSSVVSRRGLASDAEKKKKTSGESVPTRKSLRLQNMAADTSLVLPDKEPTVVVQDEHPRLKLDRLELADVVTEQDDVEDKRQFLQEMVEAIGGGNRGGGGNANRVSFEVEKVDLNMISITVRSKFPCARA